MKKEERIPIRISKEEKDAIIDFAMRHGSTMSEVLRLAVLKFINYKSKLR